MKRESLKRILVICIYTLLIVSCQHKSKWQMEEEKFFGGIISVAVIMNVNSIVACMFES